MELLSMIGITGVTIKYIIAIFGMMSILEFCRIHCGRFHVYKDPSGITVIKDRKTNHKYMKTEDSNIIKLDD